MAVRHQPSPKEEEARLILEAQLTKEAREAEEAQKTVQNLMELQCPMGMQRAELVEGRMSRKRTRPRWCTVYVVMEIHYIPIGEDPLRGEP